jgi:hypothetical protein
MVARNCRVLGARSPSTADGYGCVSTASHGNGVRGYTDVPRHTTTDSDGRRPCVILRMPCNVHLAVRARLRRVRRVCVVHVRVRAKIRRRRVDA